MKKAMAKGLILIVEAGIEVLADQIKKRRKRNEHPDQLDHFPYGRGAYAVGDRSAANSAAVDGRRAMRKRNTHGPSIFKERQ